MNKESQNDSHTKKKPSSSESRFTKPKTNLETPTTQCRGEVRKAKDHLELKLERGLKDNKKYFLQIYQQQK